MTLHGLWLQSDEMFFTKATLINFPIQSSQIDVPHYQKVIADWTLLHRRWRHLLIFMTKLNDIYPPVICTWLYQDVTCICKVRKQNPNKKAHLGFPEISY